MVWIIWHSYGRVNVVCEWDICCAVYVRRETTPEGCWVHCRDNQEELSHRATFPHLRYFRTCGLLERMLLAHGESPARLQLRSGPTANVTPSFPLRRAGRTYWQGLKRRRV